MNAIDYKHYLKNVNYRLKELTKESNKPVTATEISMRDSEIQDLEFKKGVYEEIIRLQNRIKELEKEPADGDK